MGQDIDYVCVAQLDRALGYGPRCREFESSHARRKNLGSIVLSGFLYSGKDLAVLTFESYDCLIQCKKYMMKKMLLCDKILNNW